MNSKLKLLETFPNPNPERITQLFTQLRVIAFALDRSRILLHYYFRIHTG